MARIFRGQVDVVCGGLWGSEGKGKFLGYLALSRRYDVSINNNRPNAGHTFVFDDGRKVITTHIPIALVNPNIQLLIGAGAAIEPEKLYEEIETYADLIGDRKIYIHELASIVTESDREYERHNIRSGSTFKGSTASRIKKIMRDPTAVLAGSYNWNNPHIEIFNDNLMIDILNKNKNILVEMSQGFQLGINHGSKYPYTTGDECDVNLALSYCGIPNDANITKYCVIRPYEIRINNQSEMGEIYTGDCGNSSEIDFTDVEAMSGCENLTELTTRTKKKRRIFSFEWECFYHTVCMLNPTYLVLNFAQQLDARISNLNEVIDLQDCENEENKNASWLMGTNPVMDFIENLEREYDTPVAYVGTGPKNGAIIDMNIDRRAPQYFGCREYGENEEITSDSYCENPTGPKLTYSRRHF